YGEEHFARFAGLSDVDLLITDSGLSPEDTAAIEAVGTEVVRT
ncbi:D-beta-D-heptose 1-phosphate adenosyltransferase, partial [Streptomyces sp. NPDC054841]